MADFGHEFICKCLRASFENVLTHDHEYWDTLKKKEYYSNLLAAT